MPLTLAHYELLEPPIGKGGFAKVYRARHRLGHLVAVKVLSSNEDDEFVRLFEQEARAAAQLRHRHIVAVNDQGMADGKLYIEMVLVDGKDIEQRVKAEGQFKLERAVAITEQIASALDFAHARGIVHRDVKSANIILRDDDHATLTDFGLMKAISGSLKTSTILTQAHGFLGSPPYMSPEQTRTDDQSHVDSRADQYSLAIVLYEMLTARVPFFSKDLIAVAVSQRQDTPPPPTQFRPDLPEGIEAIILKALAKKPDDRYESCGAFAQALRAILNALADEEQRQRAEAARAQLLVEAEERVKIKDWSGALTLIAKLLAAHADDRAALELQARVLKAMQDEASAQAVQAEQTRQLETQTARARELKQQTDEAIAKEDWAEAARRASAWQVLAPTDTSAAAALTHAQEKLRQSFAFAQDKSLISNQRPPLLLTLAGNVTLELLHIPAGEFLMGSDKAQDSQASNDEIPQHKIYLSDYYIAKYPTTNAQWAAYMGAAKKTFEIPKGKEAHPVVNVTWYEARAFCEWASKATKQQVRLPTEAEWEKGARGADGRIYPWGDKLPDDTHCNFNRNVKDTTPVGRYSPGGDSPYGCVDMAGNVWEWCNDWYDESYYKNSPSQNPTGPSSGRYYRVLRGGSWLSSTNYVRASLRLRVGPSFINHLDVGFRCAYSL